MRRGAGVIENEDPPIGRWWEKKGIFTKHLRTANCLKKYLGQTTRGVRTWEAKIIQRGGPAATCE